MITFPNAKINLGLRITSRRPDGYHNLETVFYPIPLCDALEIVPATDEENKFNQTGMLLDGNPEDNLVLKAYRLLNKDFDLPRIDVYLRKNIPVGAGLGGGSSDAAFMLQLLNEFAALNLMPEKLEEYASQLGADCPFFIRNKPMYAEGTGDQFFEIDLSLKGCFLLLIHPGIFISTKEAFAGIHPQKTEISLPKIIEMPVNQWANFLFNDFEESIFRRYPEIQKIKEELYNEGALYASMSGSGSSVFGIFNTKPNLAQNWKNYRTSVLSLNF